MQSRPITEPRLIAALQLISAMSPTIGPNFFRPLGMVAVARALTRKLATSKLFNWALCVCHIRVLGMANSTKEAINIMKPKQIIISILAALFVFPLAGTFAQQAASSGSIEVITTFDYPGAGNSTLPQKINERGDVVGVFIDSNGVTRGFVRFSNGSFSAPIVDPNDTVGFTEG